MKIKAAVFYAFFFLMLGILPGCMGSYSSIRPAEQQEILKSPEGELLKSKAPYEGAAEKENLVELEIEIPGFPSWRRYYWTDKALWGNRGFTIGESRAEYVVAPEKIPVTAGYEPILDDLKMKLKSVQQPEDEIVIIEQPIYDQRRAYEETVLAEEANLSTAHTVKKGESLWLIAGYSEVYGNPLEWPKIFQANRDRILDPNLIYPDQMLRIPRGMDQIPTASLASQQPAPIK